MAFIRSSRPIGGGAPSPLRGACHPRRPFLFSRNSVDDGRHLGAAPGYCETPSSRRGRTSAELGNLLRSARARGRGLDRPAVLGERRAGRWMGGGGGKCHCTSGPRQDRSAFASPSRHRFQRSRCCLKRPLPWFQGVPGAALKDLIPTAALGGAWGAGNPGGGPWVSRRHRPPCPPHPLVHQWPETGSHLAPGSRSALASSCAPHSPETTRPAQGPTNWQRALLSAPAASVAAGVCPRPRRPEAGFEGSVPSGPCPLCHC